MEGDQNAREINRFSGKLEGKGIKLSLIKTVYNLNYEITTVPMLYANACRVKVSHITCIDIWWTTLIFNETCI